MKKKKAVPIVEMSFILENQPNQYASAKIYLYNTLAGKSFLYYTGHTVFPINWDKVNQCVKSEGLSKDQIYYVNIINEKLSKIKKAYYQAISYYYSQGIKLCSIPRDELRSTINKFVANVNHSVPLNLGSIGECVYLIRIKQSNMYKIGRTNNLHNRLTGLYTSCPSELEVVGYKQTTNSVAEEKRIHKLFAEYRKKGEWFLLKDVQMRMVLKELDNTVNCQ